MPTFMAIYYGFYIRFNICLPGGEPLRNTDKRVKNKFFLKLC